MKSLSSIFFVLLLLLAAPWAFAVTDTIDFESETPGDIVSSVFGAGLTGPVTVRGENPNCAASNAAVIFDSNNPTGGDDDLGSPNETCPVPGPGVGTDGEFLMPNENCVDRGNVLIVHERCGDLGGASVADPDDADLVGSLVEFDFSAVGPVTIESILIMDVEAEEPSAVVDLYDEFNALLASFNLPQTGDNGVQTVGLGPTPGVARMVVTLNGSGAIDNVVFTVPDEDGEACTPGYWRNHLDSWAAAGINPNADFDTTFGVDLFSPDIILGAEKDNKPSPTQSAIWRGGGGNDKLARHGTAALLNASHPDVDYSLTAGEVIALVQAGDADALADANDDLECPLN